MPTWSALTSEGAEISYLLLVLALILVLGSAATGLNLLVGYTGRLSLLHGALFGLGAYSSAILAVSADWYPYTSIAAAGALGGFFAWSLGWFVRRSSGDSFALQTFCLHLLFLELVRNWSSMTRGPIGIAGVPSLPLFDLGTRGPWAPALLGAFLLASAIWIGRALAQSAAGRALLAMRDDSALSDALGVHRERLVHQLMTVSGLLCGLAGALYAHLVGLIAPQMVTEMLSVSLLSMVIVGGAGSLAGGALGAIVVIGLPEAARLVGASGPQLANWRQILFGALLLFLIVWRPRGLLGQYELGRKS